MCGSSLVHVMAWHLFGAKPLPEPMMIYYSFGTPELISVNFFLLFSSKTHLKFCLQNAGHFVLTSVC